MLYLGPNEVLTEHKKVKMVIIDDNVQPWDLMVMIGLLVCVGVGLCVWAVCCIWILFSKKTSRSGGKKNGGSGKSSEEENEIGLMQVLFG